MTGNDQPARRRHHRASRPATGGNPAWEDGSARLGADDPDLAEGESSAEQRGGVGSDDWWQAQRPPHWEQPS